MQEIRPGAGTVGFGTRIQMQTRSGAETSAEARSVVFRTSRLSAPCAPLPAATPPSEPKEVGEEAKAGEFRLDLDTRPIQHAQAKRGHERGARLVGAAEA